MLRFYAGKTVLVTGASSGIGEAFVRALAPAGGTLLLTARSEARLDALAADVRAAGAQAHSFPLDLAAPGAADRLADAVGVAGHRVDVLVNNAGFGHLGPFEVAGADIYGEMVRLNAEAPTVLARRLLPEMGPGGGLLHIASTAAFQPLPGFAVYAATKAYGLSLAEALHAEFAPRGVRVTCLCPGPTATAFGARARMAPAFFRGAMTAEAVARAGLVGFARGRRTVVPGPVNALGAWLGQYAPRRAGLALTRAAFARLSASP